MLSVLLKASSTKYSFEQTSYVASWTAVHHFAVHDFWLPDLANADTSRLLPLLHCSYKVWNRIKTQVNTAVSHIDSNLIFIRNVTTWNNFIWNINITNCTKICLKSTNEDAFMIDSLVIAVVMQYSAWKKTHTDLTVRKK